jgi:hypothetical protein
MRVTQRDAVVRRLTRTNVDFLQYIVCGCAYIVLLARAIESGRLHTRMVRINAYSRSNDGCYEICSICPGRTWPVGGTRPEYRRNTIRFGSRTHVPAAFTRIIYCTRSCIQEPAAVTFSSWRHFEWDVKSGSVEEQRGRNDSYFFSLVLYIIYIILFPAGRFVFVGCCRWRCLSSMPCNYIVVVTLQYYYCVGMCVCLCLCVCAISISYYNMLFFFFFYDSLQQFLGGGEWKCRIQFHPSPNHCHVIAHSHYIK